jgi:hypothetical protein
MDEEDGRLGPPPGHIIGNGAYSAKYGTRQRDGFQDPGRLQLLVDVTVVRARQPGRVDVLTDASMMSLCSSPANIWSCAGDLLRSLYPAHPQIPSVRIHTRLKENCYENVPGK